MENYDLLTCYFDYNYRRTDAMAAEQDLKLDQGNPEEEGGGEAHKAIRRKKDNTKLSERYREHWKEWQEFSAQQGWT